jgi:hypothetical protein
VGQNQFQVAKADPGTTLAAGDVAITFNAANIGPQRIDGLIGIIRQAIISRESEWRGK